MAETVREWMARLAAETAADWIEIEEERGTHLVAGRLSIGSEAVAFEDDSGLSRVIPFRSIRAVARGRQGDATVVAIDRFEPIGEMFWREAG